MTNANGFLPDGYEVPKSWGKYVRLGKGDTKLRILSSPLLGWEYFTTENKPKRFNWKEKPKETPWIKKWDKIKEFWAMPVWNYKDECIQIWQISQVSIKEAINNLVRNEDWGSPLEYDLTINKKWEWYSETKYSVTPSPKKIPDEKIMWEWQEIKIDLKKLITWEDPFLNL